MKHLIFTILLVASHLLCLAQKISYDIPDGYQQDISRSDYKTIVDAALPIVGKRYSIESVKDGTIHLKPGQEMQALNLHNVITKCVVVSEKSQWNAIVLQHFQNLFTSIDEKKKIDPANYQTVRNYLSLRIYPKETIEARGGAASLVARTDLEGTYSLLMLDLPGAFTPVSRQMFDLWNVDVNEVFKVAQVNINKQQIQKVTQNFDVDGVQIEISFLGNEDYAASYALDLLNNSPEFVGEWGSVIAIPNKGLVDLCKISKDKPVDFVKFIQKTKPLVEKSFREHEQPISDKFFWYYKGQFTWIKVLTNPDGTLNVISPYGLSQLMTEKK